MAAKDYEIVAGLQDAYIARKTKPKKNIQVISKDRKVITENEIISLFLFFVRKCYREHKKDSIVVSDKNGKKLFSVMLFDMED